MYRGRILRRLSLHRPRECDQNQQGGHCSAHVRAVLDDLHGRPRTIRAQSRPLYRGPHRGRHHRAPPWHHGHHALLPHGCHDHCGTRRPERRFQLCAPNPVHQQQACPAVAHLCPHLRAFGHSRQPHHEHRDGHDTAQTREEPPRPPALCLDGCDSRQLRRCLLAHRRRHHHHALEPQPHHRPRRDKRNLPSLAPLHGGACLHRVAGPQRQARHPRHSLHPQRE